MSINLPQEGDRIAMMRRSNGTLHFFINGLDQGVAATNAPPTVWGVVDLYGMTVKVRVRRVRGWGGGGFGLQWVLG